LESQLVAGGGDHHVDATQVGGGERGVLAGVGGHHVDAWQDRLKSFGHRHGAFEQRHVVVPIDEVEGDRGPH
jgi:hypothetical protein